MKKKKVRQAEKRKSKNPLRSVSRQLAKRYMRTGYEKRRRANIQERLCAVYPMQSAERLLLEYYAERVELLMVILCAGALLFLVTAIGGQENKKGTVTAISRNSYQEGAREEELQVTIGKEQAAPIRVEVQERAYTEEEIKALLKETAENLGTLILGENQSLDLVTGNLSLITEAKDGLISIQWESDLSTLISADGVLQEEELTEEGTLVNLEAVLTAQGQNYIQQLAVLAKKPEQSSQEKRLSLLKDKIRQADEEEKTEAALRLPEEVEGQPVIYEQANTGSQAGAALWLLLAAAGIAAFRGKSEKLKKAAKDRDRQLELDYPELISKLTLLFLAGLTIRSAWNRIVTEYIRGREAGKPLRYAYEEMLLTTREMQSGMQEGEAYDRFGRRCKLAGYVKLGVLLKQNLQKGSRGLTQLLTYEGIQAMEERKNLAKRMGEEASTKLLLPMLLMLAVVLIILIVPALLSMGF